MLQMAARSCSASSKPACARAPHTVKAGHASVQIKNFAKMPAHPLLEFFPAVAVFGLSGIGILFPEEGSQKLCGVFSLHAEAEDEEGHSSFTFLGVTDRRSPGKKRPASWDQLHLPAKLSSFNF